VVAHDIAEGVDRGARRIRDDDTRIEILVGRHRLADWLKEDRRAAVRDETARVGRGARLARHGRSAVVSVGARDIAETGDRGARRIVDDDTRIEILFV
jgi:hypothetical protein